MRTRTDPTGVETGLCVLVSVCFPVGHRTGTWGGKDEERGSQNGCGFEKMLLESEWMSMFEDMFTRLWQDRLIHHDPSVLGRTT